MKMIHLFGYFMEREKNQEDTILAEIVRQTFADYICGKSLKEKADELTKARVEYEPGKCEWNKNRIHRMLTDRRYLGTGLYPPIVDKETFEKVQHIMAERNTQKNCKRETIFSTTIVPLVCGKCSYPTKRSHDSRKKNKIRFHCQNPDCKESYPVTDEQLWKRVWEQFQVLKVPKCLTAEEENHEIERLTNEIEQEMQYDSADFDSISKKIYRCAALKYRVNAPQMTESMDFSQMKPYSPIFIRELQRRVLAVRLYHNGEIELVPRFGKEG